MEQVILKQIRDEALSRFGKSWVHPSTRAAYGRSFEQGAIYAIESGLTESEILSKINAIINLSKPILTMPEAAAFMGVTMSNLYKLVHMRRVPHYKSEGGKFTYFKRTELEAWLTAVRVPTDDELDAQAITKHNH